MTGCCVTASLRAVQRRLLEQPDLTLDMVKETVIAMKVVSKDSRTLSMVPVRFVAPANAL